ncbi:MAG: DNA translocase FtsK [Clostridia bacterium]
MEIKEFAKNAIINFKEEMTTEYNENIMEEVYPSYNHEFELDEEDTILEEAIELIIEMNSASASMLQRRFRIGYSRAARLIDQIELLGIISGYNGSNPREVLITKEDWSNLKNNNDYLESVREKVKERKIQENIRE